MARKGTYRSGIESEETAEVIVRQSPAEIEVPQPQATAQPIRSEPGKPTAAILPIYLREMGATPLIDENQEVALARELQDARVGLAKIALKLPAACRLYTLGAGYRRSQARPRVAARRPGGLLRQAAALQPRESRRRPRSQALVRQAKAVQAPRQSRARRADPGQPAPGGAHRQEVPQPRHLLHGPDPGRQHRADEGGGEVRVRARQQVLHVRVLVDQAGHRASDRRQGARDPDPGARQREDQEDLAHLEGTRRDAGPQADAGRDRHASCACRWPRSRRSSASSRSRRRSRTCRPTTTARACCGSSPIRTPRARSSARSTASFARRSRAR